MKHTTSIRETHFSYSNNFYRLTKIICTLNIEHYFYITEDLFSGRYVLPFPVIFCRQIVCQFHLFWECNWNSEWVWHLSLSLSLQRHYQQLSSQVFKFTFVTSTILPWVFIEEIGADRKFCEKLFCIRIYKRKVKFVNEKKLILMQMIFSFSSSRLSVSSITWAILFLPCWNIVIKYKQNHSLGT